MKLLYMLMLLSSLLPASLQAAPRDIPTFTSPEKVYTGKSTQWIQQPVVYDQGVDADIVLSLDQQLYDSMLPLINTYARDHHLTIVTGKGTCGISAGNIDKKSVDIGGFCCPPAENDRLPGLTWHTIGIAPIALIVPTANHTRTISLAQARDIFSGNLYNWGEVVGSQIDGLIHPIGRLHCKQRPGHWRLLLEHEDDFSPDLMEVGAISDMIRTVAMDKQAIGYETEWMIQTFNSKHSVRTVAIDGAYPDEIASTRYPLYRTYNLTSWSSDPAKNRLAEELIQYLLKQADTLPAHFHLVPASLLRQQGWHFQGDELTGEPDHWK
ncbi:hypothetical protein FEF65_06455 [Mariprofundus erugo]|uniref:PBP domain-containing protein n=1 Tax=Mariprofundus erugo TaxID=2528639 RepID=A0A5R9GWT1_9PROT|nr:hypothetical protein [Mariprofundus erugo]TLS67554.1 hypothetical protein FEF65_06455 [Mariprofundus erugo]